MDVVKEPDSSREEQLIQMVERYQRSLLTICYAYLHDRALAEDAVQETFLRAYRALGSFRSASSEKTWLTSIAINVCRSWRRAGWFARVNRSVTPEELPLAAGDDFDQEAADLAAAIRQLPDPLKEVVLLYYYQELTTTEVAKIVGVSSSMVSRRLKKALARLQAALGKEEHHG